LNYLINRLKADLLAANLRSFSTFSPFVGRVLGFAGAFFFTVFGFWAALDFFTIVRECKEFYPAFAQEPVRSSQSGEVCSQCE